MTDPESSEAHEREWEEEVQEYRTQEREKLLQIKFANDVSHLNANSRRHLKEGFLRRAQIMELNRIRIGRTTEGAGARGLPVYETIELNADLNSYYVQLRGALDNLAWALHYHFAVLGDQDEDSSAIRYECDLFGKKFRKSLKRHAPALSQGLCEKLDWSKEVRELRDPVAHRIPLYVPPGVITTEEDQERVERLYQEANALFECSDLQGGLAKEREGHAVGEFLPLIIMSGPSGLEVKPLHSTLQRDRVEFLEVGEFVSEALGTQGRPAS